MKRGVVFFIFAGIFLFFTLNTVFAQRGSNSGEVIEVKLASLTPRNSDWGDALEQMASEWKRVTNNQIRLRVLHNAVEGDERKCFTSLQANNIQASVFTSFGVSNFCSEVMTLSVPFMIRNDAELNLVLPDVLPRLETKINTTGFVVIAWAKLGWVNVFSRNPVVAPGDLRNQKLATNAESVDLNTVFKTMGFTLVETGLPDVAPRLANNQINAVYQIPPYVAATGTYKTVGNMLDLPIAPALGAIVMNRVTWNKLSANHQREILRVTQKIAADFDAATERTAANAVTKMQREGLKLNKPTSSQEEMWRAEVQKAMPELLGKTFDRDIYQRINDILKETRNGQ